MKKILFLFLILIIQIKCSDKKAEIVTFKKQLGTFALDIHKTALGINAKDSNIYKNLLITFRSDSSFSMNMKVPFMHDSIGKWIAGDGSPYSYNLLFYKNFNYSKSSTGEHFYPPSSDSTFLLNSTTPQNKNNFIEEIYFKKIRTK